MRQARSLELFFRILGVLFYTAGLVSAPASQASGQEAPGQKYAGSASCRECHEPFYQRWAPSHHGLAMQDFTSEFAARSLTEQTTEVQNGGRRYRVERAGNAGWVREQGPEGEKKYPILHVLGGKNVFYFLTAMERGRLQTLPVAYDVKRKEWFDTAASGIRHVPSHPDTAVSWKDPAYTFNTSCHGCHVSQLSTNYDLPTDSYHTTWAEPGINCETCHGPASEHVRAARALVPGQKLPALKLISTKPFSHEQKNTMCAPCHAKMIPLSTTFMPGARYFDHYDLATLEDPDFYPDGRDLGENYTYTLWRMNPCAKSGQLDCLHCHTSSGRYRFTGEKPADANQACLPCHSERVKNAAVHTHHKSDGQGNRCVSCHMPQTEFARMARSDHSLRPPMPGATLAFKSPNACNNCHADRDAAWADKLVREWSPRDYQAAPLHWAGLINAARKGDWSRLPEMLDTLQRPERDEIVVNSLIRLLRQCDDARKWPAILAAMKDPSPLVRSSAAEALSDILTPASLPKLLAAAHDEYKVVRIRSVAALAGVMPQLMDTEARKDLAPAVEEFKTSMLSRPDDFAGHYNLGNFYLAGRDPSRAIAAYETASRLRPDAVLAHVNCSLAYITIGQNDKAEQSLRRALAIEPGNLAANINLGMLLGELGRPDEAEAAFRTALKTEPKSAVAAFNLGVITSQKSMAEAIHWCRLAYELRPGEPKYGYTLAFYQRQQGDALSAIAVLKATLGRNPQHSDSVLLLGDIYESQDKRAEAMKLYFQAIQRTDLSNEVRQQLLQKLR
jgi:Tfp pilus assembly protein PilF